MSYAAYTIPLQLCLTKVRAVKGSVKALMPTHALGYWTVSIVDMVSALLLALLMRFTISNLVLAMPCTLRTKRDTIASVSS